MIQLIVLGFFVCLGGKAAIDIYEWGKKFITHEGKDAVKKGLKKAKEEVDEHILHKGDKTEKKEGDAATA